MRKKKPIKHDKRLDQAEQLRAAANAVADSHKNHHCSDAPGVMSTVDSGALTELMALLGKLKPFSAN